MLNSTFYAKIEIKYQYGLLKFEINLFAAYNNCR